MMASTCDMKDDLFGPIIHGCRSNFDFTLLFEQTILSIPPAALLLLLVPPRLVKLQRSRKKTFPTPIRFLKSLTALLLIGVNLALLVLWCSRQVTRATIVSAALSFAASLAVFALSRFEHSRGIRPSILLNLYLLISLVFDAVQVRTLYLRRDDSGILGLSTASTALKAVLLLLEAKSKRGYLRPPYNRFSPETTSGIFNQSFFWWLNPLLVRGFRKILTLDDLFTTDPALLSEPLQNEMQISWDKYALSGKYALVFAILHCLRWSLVSMIFPRLCLVAFNYAQPFLISSAISYVSQSSPNKNDGYGLIAATGLVYLGIAISTAHFQYRVGRLLTKFRGAMVSLIYARSLKIPAGVYDESAALTLMSTDVTMLTTSLEALCDIWARVIEISIGIWLLERQLGWVCVAPLVVVAGSVYASAYVAKIIGPRQKVWTKAIQRRVGTTSSMLGSMKSVKMMGLSNILFDIIQSLRIRELDISKKYRVMSLWRLLLSFLPTIVGPFATFVIFAISSKASGSSPLSADKTFSSLAIISLLTSPASDFLQTLPLVGMATSGLQRIQTFLLASPHDDRRTTGAASENTHNALETNDSVELQDLVSIGSGDAIIVDRICVRPAADAPVALRDISLRAPKGSLTMVIGVVGSGKSTLLKALAGEVKFESGSVRVSSKRSAYCAQTPWLQNATVRQIICGPLEGDEEWYRTVIHACAFDEDMLRLPNQDDTIIGSRGVTLSGGQKQRLALARAVYARQEIIILDDVLSAIDSKTELLVVERLFGKTGIIRGLGSTVVLATHAIRHLPLADNIMVLGANGRISEQGSFKCLRSQDGFVSKVFLQPEILEQGTSRRDNIESKPSATPRILQGPTANDVAERTRRIGDLSVYKYYLSAIGWKLCCTTVVVAIVYMVAQKFPPLWLTWYSNGTVKSVALFSTIYAASAVVALVSSGGMLWTLYNRITPKSGAGLHRILLKAVMRAPQSFFDETDAGITLNRFSQDMTLIDGQLPASAVIFFSTSFQFLAQLALVAVGSSYMALTCPVLILAVYFLQKFYLRTSRQIRFLDLECKSPLYTHVAETLEGLSTIRAFGWQEAFMKTNIERLDTSQKPSYLLYCIQRWLGLVLQLLVAVMAVAVVALATNLTNTTSGGRLGVSLSQIVTFNSSLGFLLTFWTMLETSLGAIARLKGFQEGTKSEDRVEEIFVPDDNWPSTGAVEFKNVSASYGPESPALREISFKIPAGSKIGICGRTGSGKSSLLSVLLRILDLDSGSITIDSLDLSHIPREIIRSRLITIPQDPFILAGSVRLNADPTSSAPDTLIIRALQKVKLWDILETRGGLDAEMLTNPLSQGQAQIFCLARAMLRTAGGKGRGILVLDEATSNVDAETDQLMQRVIREEFSGFTIITVAHRLETIRDSDWIAVLDGGRLVEWDRPSVVLGREGNLGQGNLRA